MHRSHHRRALGALVAIGALALVGTAYAGSSDTTDKTFGSHYKAIRLVETNKELQPTFVDTGKPGLSPGDLVVARDELLHSNGSPAGSFRQVCTLVDPASNPFTSTYECSGSIALKGGTITMQGPFLPAQPEQAAAITGGTGEYRTAQGEIAMRAEADEIIVRLVR
jgi:hypothetical protein